MTTDWQTLCSDIYIRDKGICWICNTFVPLDKYDLGHLVDRCMNGHDDYDNLAVMHESCNLSKPHHKTLEEAMKWRLTTFVPVKLAMKDPTSRLNSDYKKDVRRSTKTSIHLSKHNLVKPIYPKPISRKILAKRQKAYEDACKRIMPATICWIQGRPMGGPMWRLLPPPYKQSDMFIMRQTPPGAIDNDESTLEESLQIINGKLKEIVSIDVGPFTYIIAQDNNGKLEITSTTNKYSNSGEVQNTIGEGRKQIPIDLWLVAKGEGLTFQTFIEMFGANSSSA